MKLFSKGLIISILILNYSNINADQCDSNFEYILTPVLEEKDPYLKVEMKFKGNNVGITLLEFPQMWAGVSYKEQIKNKIILDSSIKYQIDKKNSNNWILKYAPGQIITLSYEVHQKKEDPSDIHEAIIRKDLVHATGYGLFALPNMEECKSNRPMDFSVNWNNAPENWLYASSYNNTSNINFKGSEGDLLHSIYTAGKSRHYDLPMKENSVLLSLYGDFNYSDQELVESLTNIIASQREFFKDYDFPYYLISIVEGDQPQSIGGTGLNNNFSAYIPKDIDSRNVRVTLTHEHLHNWIGGKLKNNKEEKLNYWWSEGFTDYYTRVLGLRTKTISLEEFINECNELLSNYYLSPVHNAPNSRIKADFWKNYDVQKLPYNRGFTFAFSLNNKIKLHSNNKSSLDNLMYELISDAKKNKIKFSNKLFIKYVNKYLANDLSKEFDKIIVKGGTIDLEPLKNALPLVKVKLGPYERGFDREACLNEKIIKEIKPNSNAYKAGLRDGDKIIKYDFPKGSSPDQIVTIATERGTFNYRPESQDKIDVWQFKTDLNDEEKQQIEDWFK